MVRNEFSNPPPEYTEIPPNADLRRVLTAERELRNAAGWDAEDIPTKYTFLFFCRKDGVRHYVGIQAARPGDDYDRGCDGCWALMALGKVFNRGPVTVSFPERVVGLGVRESSDSAPMSGRRWPFAIAAAKLPWHNAGTPAAANRHQVARRDTRKCLSYLR